MIPYRKIVERSRRQDHEENVWLQPIAARISPWFTWVFINLGFSANQVTVLSFLCGVGAAVSILNDTLAYAFAALVLFRLHALFDICDGEVARYRKQVSRFGVYWDQMMHVVVYPLILAGLVWGRLHNGGELALVAFGMLGMIGKSADLAAKSLYYRVLYAAHARAPNQNINRGLSQRAKRIRFVLSLVLRLNGYDALLLFFAVGYLIPFAWLGLEARDWVVVVYSLIFVLMASVRIVLIPLRDEIPTRKDFR